MSDSADLTVVLSWLQAAVAASQRDYAHDPFDAYIFGVLVGWECEENHEHGPTCRGEALMSSLAKTHGWREDYVAMLREHRAIVRAALNDPALPASSEEKTT